MKLGLITDVHEQLEYLRQALEVFRHEQVDQILLIGDICETGARLEETCEVLAAARVAGVWGNHDYGLCNDPDAEVAAQFPSSIAYMRGLRPRMEIEGSLFCHVEPWLNPECLEEIWHFEGPPDSQAKLDRIFAAVSHRLIFAGHYHRWLLCSPTGIHAWHGTEPIRLVGSRYFVVIGALCEGRFAIFNTESALLVPYDASAPRLETT